jgi:ArsR family transcriptional regulator
MRIDEVAMDPCCPPDDCAPAPAPTGPLTGPAAEEELAAYTKALGHPARVHILTHLRAQRACIAGELADQLPLAPSTVSRHLKVLKDAGLITGEIDGPRRCYCVDTAALARFQALVAAL